MADTYLTASGTNDHTAINSAISGSSAGDTVYLADGTYDIADAILTYANVSLVGTSTDGTVLKANATLTSSNVIFNYGVNNGGPGELRKFTVDCNFASGTNGIQLRFMDSAVLEDIVVKDTNANFIGIYGVTNSRLSRVATEQDLGTAQGTSHGTDIDFHDNAANLSENILLEDCIFINTVQGDAAKVEAAVDVTYLRCTFNESTMTIGGTVASYGAKTENLQFINCTFNCVVRLLKTGVHTTSIRRCTFTDYAGILLVDAACDGTLLVDENTVFEGRNAIIGFDGTIGAGAWDDTIVASVLVDEGFKHNNVSPFSAEKTVFASNNDVGSMYYSGGGKHPFITPATAADDYVTLCRNAAVVKDYVSCALLSDYGEHSFSGETTTIVPSVAAQAYYEGYPNKATIDATGTLAHLFGLSANMGDDTVFYNFIIKNMPAGYKAFSGETNAPTTSVTKVISVDFVDSLSRTTELSLIRNTAELQFISCTFSNIKGSSLNGTICRTNQADDTLVFKGCKFTDIESNAGAVRNTNATSTVLLEGCEFIRCVGNSVGGMLTTGLTEVDNCTFIDNSGSVAEDINFIGGTLTVRNCILQGTGTISGSPTLVTNLTTPPAFIDDTVDNYELVAADAGGTKYWGNSGRPHGANGESFPDSSIDRGANQSTFNANHPYNF